MSRGCLTALVVMSCVVSVTSAAPASAAETVTYEIVSDSIHTLDVEYVDQLGRNLLHSVSLPWRRDVTLDDAKGPIGRGAQVRADWRSIARPADWVTVRIYGDGQLLCQSILDVGNASCYGNTPHFS